MSRDFNNSSLSELEQEFELEMDDLELDEERESDVEFEDSSDSEEEHEEDMPGELEALDGEGADYAERFFELSQREYESEAEADEKINGLLGEIEQDHFSFKNLGKRLLKKGVKFAAGNIPALKALKGITQLARGDLKGMLASLAKAGLSSAIPGGAAVLPALSALGFEAAEDPEANREAWDNYVEVCKEAYEHLAQNLNERADDPLVASELAAKSFQTAIKRVHGGVRSGIAARSNAEVSSRSRSRKRVVYLEPGESVVVRRR